MAVRDDEVPCKLLVFTFITLLIAAAHAHDPSALISTKLGPIQGVTQLIPNAHGPIKAIHKFLGIPYAAAPIGALRFAPPQPHKGWKKDGVYKATYFKSICMQMIHHYNVSIRQAWDGFSEMDNISEDCLYLNIYTPFNAAKTFPRYPVLAYIHGGGFFAGTPVQIVSPGEYLPLRGVILVSIQYRLGPFGFFSTGDSKAPGNYGMLDQVQALRWIKENIRSFGGDPSRVTLFGESSGGASVNLHLLSPLSKGLFHRIITESGTDLSPFAFHDNSGVSRSSRHLAGRLNCADTKNMNRMLQCLRSKNERDILKSATNGYFYPVVDKRFLLDSPLNLRKAGKFQKLPAIAGFVSHEGSFLLGSALEEYDKTLFRKKIEAHIINSIVHSADAERKPLLVDAVEFQYTHWPGNNNNASKIRQSLIDAFTDYYVVAPTHASLAFQSRYSKTWLYEFRHRSEHSPKENWRGVAHGDITAYVFGVPLLNLSSPHPYTEEDRNISDFMVTVYTNFVKFGLTTPQPVYGVDWGNFKPTDQAYLRIEANPHMRRNFKPLKIAFWNDYLPGLSKSAMACQGPEVRGTKSAGNKNKFYAWDLLFIIFILNVWDLT